MKRLGLLLLVLAGVHALHAGEGDLAKVGDKAATFSATTSDGTAVTPQTMAGKVVLLDFFATWCGPCVVEMPVIEKEVWQPLRDKGLVLYAVGREHSVDELAKFKAEKGFTFPILADPKREIYGQYATMYIPRCYVIGKDGLIKFASTGYKEDGFAEMKKVIEAELGK